VTEELKNLETFESYFQQFPLNQPIPYELITEIVKYSLKENSQIIKSTKVKEQ